ncbi:MAG: hypothetical protein H6977_13950 [Gammaproteobacteria bacterium]|nr:hypothetical protein [Gammaproteobacteria bacterium]MCP5201113.1 hypothetical protein [Gammaproteobacteria bacterium]
MTATPKNAAPGGLPVPLPLLVLNAVGVACLAGGVLGLTAPDSVPALSSTPVAWSLIAVGAVMDGYAMLGIVGSARRAREARAG